MANIIPTATAVTLSLLATLVAAVDVRAGEPRIIIRIYDTATGDSGLRSAAMRTAAALVADAGIPGDWRDCSVGGEHYPCLSVRGAGDLVVRVAPRFVAGAKIPDGSISTRQTPNDPDLQLGFASFDAQTHIGVVATIFHDRVLTVARRADLKYSELLGRAMAHEIGHLILRVAGHSRTGLMRAVWTDAELTQNRHEDWVFAPAERDRLLAASTVRPSR